MPRSVIIVLGMHRSGTSCLMGNLEQAGVFLGDVNRHARYNAKGTRENRAVMELNDAVLADNGAAWNRPPESSPVWSDAHRARRDRILASYPPDQIIGFKEPRTLLTLDGWLEALHQPLFAGSFRHPATVAESLRHRNGIPLERGLDLWLAYNKRLLSVARSHKLPVISFDLPADQYRRALTSICQSLGLTSPAGGLHFFDAELRHNAPPNEMPQRSDVREIFEALLAISTRA